MLAHAGSADESLAIAMVLVALWVGWIGRSRLKGMGFGRLPRPAAYAALAAAAGLLAASAIVPRALFPRTVPPPAGAAPIASTATLAFVRPADGALATGTQLELVLRLDGGRVIDATSPVTPDTGHIHVSVDGKLVSMTYGTVQVLDLRPYGPGTHTITAEFVAADHRSFTPPVTATRTFRRPAS
jgi:hypothetical protein